MPLATSVRAPMAHAWSKATSAAGSFLATARSTSSVVRTLSDAIPSTSSVFAFTGST
jgi:hypothetical protein